MKKSILVALTLFFVVPVWVSARRQLTVTGESFMPTKVYDGTTDVSGFTAGTLVGVTAGDTVYLSTTAAYLRSGASDTVSIAVIYTISGPQAGDYLPPANRLLSGRINRKQLYATSSVTVNKVYDGSRSAVSSLVSTRGVVGNDDVTVTSSALYNDKHKGVNKVITVSYAFSGSDVANYVLPSDSVIGNGSIDAKPITLNAPMLYYSKTYDGTDKVTVLDSGSVTGVYAGDDAHFVVTPTYFTVDAGSNLDVRVVYSFTGSDGGNYVAPSTQLFNGVGTISPKQLTVGTATTVQASKVYDRTTSCIVTFDGQAAGVVENDDITLVASAAYFDSNVGQGKNVRLTYQIFGADSANYLAPLSRITTADITALRLSVRSSSVRNSKIYDANVSVDVLSQGELRNVLPGDSVNHTTTAVYDNKNVGTNKDIYVSYTIDGPDAANYSAPLADTVHFNAITAVSGTVSGTVVQLSRIYDGMVGATVTSGDFASLAGDNVILNATAAYNDKNVGTNKTITVSYSLSGADAANYVTPADSLFIGEITPRALTIAQHSVVQSSKPYDRTTDCQVVTEGTLSGVVSGDDVRLRTSATYMTKDVDTSKTVNLVYTLYGNDSANYIAPDSAVAYADITPLQLDIIPCRVDSVKVYDANVSAQVDSVGSLIGVLAGDNVTVVPTAVYDNKNAGTNKDIYVSYVIQGVEAVNYVAPTVDTVHYNAITPLTVSASGTVVRLSKVYNGKSRASVTSPGTIPVLSGDDVTLSAVAIYDNKNVGTGKAVTLNYSLSGPDSANYVVLSVDTTGDITPLTIYVQQHSTVIPTKVYDGNTSCVKSTDGVLSGVLSGDMVVLQTSAAYLTPTVGQDKLVQVNYHLSGVDSANYVLYSDTMMTLADITPRQLTVSNINVVTSKSYDETDTAHVVYGGDLDGLLVDSLRLTTTARYDSPAIGLNKAITLSFQVTGSGVLNYILPADSIITGVITKAGLVVSGTTVRKKVYDGNTTATVLFDGNISNKVNPAHEVYVAATAYYNDPLVGTNKPVSVTFALTGADASYYNTPAPITLMADIDPLQLTVSGTMVVPTRPYDGTTDCRVVNYGILHGVISPDSVTLDRPVAVYADRHAGTDKIVTVSYGISGPDAGNYIAPVVDDTSLSASITAVPVTINNTVVRTVKQYDANTNAQVTNHGAAVTLNASDSVTVSASAAYETPDVGINKNIYVTYTLLGTEAGNYIAPATALYCDTGEITRRRIYQTGTQVVASKEYDTNTDIVVIDSGYLVGVLTGDIVTFTLTSAAYCDKNVGTHKNVYVQGTIGGPDVAKYVLDHCDTVFADITEHLITINGTTVANKYYDGCDSAYVTYIGQYTVYSGDQVVVNAEAYFSTIHPTSNATVTVHYYLSGRDGMNYRANDNVYYNKTIYPAPLRVRTHTLSVQHQKVYDATDTAKIIRFDNTLTSDDGVVAGDVVTVSASARYSDMNVGSSKQITVSFIIGGNNWGDYETPDDIIYNDGVITCKELAIAYDSTIVETEKDFDGTRVAHVVEPGELYGVIPCDSDKVWLKADAYYDNSYAGTGKTITVHYRLDGSMAKNYCIETTHVYTHDGVINPVSGVEDVREEFDITLAPNPVGVGETTYLNTEMAGNVTVEVLNAAGQRVMIEENVTFPMTIESPSTSGVYFVRIIAADGQVFIRKLIVK